ncbi:hypothetical protein H0E87_026578 [Populus deltoides]|uniref:Flavin-containing monooxygenase n=1 Tax=Populus deltoides TaxID=3696 RepID=A0A8T2WUC2_POPDE|nr:hypothetical protein H0E87_026578 [Populus deltoides]
MVSEIPLSHSRLLKKQVYEVDFVILCIGRFSDVPKIPEFPPDKGPEVFDGKVIHSVDYANMDNESAHNFVKGKRVTVTGFQKFAMGIAMECAANGRVNIHAEFYTGLNIGIYQNFILVHSQLFHKDSMIKVEEGSIILKKAPKFSFCREGIKVGDEGTSLETDLVMLATGFNGEKKLRDIFLSKVFQDSFLGRLMQQGCVHPQIPQLVVIGFSETASNQYASEIRCRWLSELLVGTLKILSIKVMEKDAGKWEKYMKRYAGQYYRKSCIAGIHAWHNDQPCKDMGWNPKRMKGFVAELFKSYGPTDYVSPYSN